MDAYDRAQGILDAVKPGESRDGWKYLRTRLDFRDAAELAKYTTQTNDNGSPLFDFQQVISFPDYDYRALDEPGLEVWGCDQEAAVVCWVEGNSICIETKYSFPFNVCEELARQGKLEAYSFFLYEDEAAVRFTC